MRFVRNEIQTPIRLVTEENRKSTPFLLMTIGVIILVAGGTGFFGAFIVRNLLQEQFNLDYHEAQTYLLAIAGAGIFLYIIGGSIIKVPLRNTSYYKLQTIMRNEPFDPPRKGDFTKSIFARLRDLEDKWALYSEVVPSKSNFKLPQVVIGPGGVYAVYPSNQHPDRRSFRDPGPELERVSKLLGQELNHPVNPFVLFPTTKLAEIYKKKRGAKSKVMHIQELFDFFNDRKRKITAEQQAEMEKIIFSLIKGTPPGK